MVVLLAQRLVVQLKITCAAQSNVSATARATGTIGQNVWVQMVQHVDLMALRAEIILSLMSTLLVDASAKQRPGVLKCLVLWTHQQSTLVRVNCLAASWIALASGVSGAHAKATV